jgi:hypothetical protein
MCADVAERRCAEQCIANRVRQAVRIGMPQQAFFKWDFDAAENQLAAFDEAMNVVAEANADCGLRIAE